MAFAVAVALVTLFGTRFSFTPPPTFNGPVLDSAGGFPISVTSSKSQGDHGILTVDHLAGTIIRATQHSNELTLIGTLRAARQLPGRMVVQSDQPLFVEVLKTAPNPGSSGRRFYLVLGSRDRALVRRPCVLVDEGAGLVPLAASSSSLCGRS